MMHKAIDNAAVGDIEALRRSAEAGSPVANMALGDIEDEVRLLGTNEAPSAGKVAGAVAQHAIATLRTHHPILASMALGFLHGLADSVHPASKENPF